MLITIEKMAKPRHDGDWHDKPLKWVVLGPGTELQQFGTKANATLYAKCRRKCDNAKDAGNLYVRS